MGECRARRRGAACIVDVETSGLDGSIIEIAVIDAATGDVLLDTLVDCSPVEIEPGAIEVHGLTAADLVGAPRWPEVFATLAAVTASRVVLAYNAKFDLGRVLHDCRREGGIDPAHLADPRPLAVRDGPPLRGARPRTGWSIAARWWPSRARRCARDSRGTADARRWATRYRWVCCLGDPCQGGILRGGRRQSITRTTSLITRLLMRSSARG